MATVSERLRVTVRSYRPADHQAARHLWAELAEEHDRLYPGLPPIRTAPDDEDEETDRGAGLEEYLARIDLSGVWVAQDDDENVIGLAGLVLRETGGQIWPVIVTADQRGRGVGRALLRQVADAAERRGMTSLTAAPASRNTAAIHCLHAAGFDALAAVELTIDLGRGRHDRRDGVQLDDLTFRV